MKNKKKEKKKPENSRSSQAYLGGLHKRHHPLQTLFDSVLDNDTRTSPRPNKRQCVRIGMFNSDELIFIARTGGVFLLLGSARHHPLGKHRFGRWRAHTRRARHAFTSKEKCVMGKNKGGNKNKKDKQLNKKSKLWKNQNKQ